MKKEIDWSFYVKIVIASIFGLYVLILSLDLLFGIRVFKPLTDDDDIDQQKIHQKSPKSNHRRPIRLRIIILNTITLYFLLMSIQEYRVNEFMSPFGVDPDKIPEKCKTQQEMYYWTVYVLCFIIVVYNFIIHYNILNKGSEKNLIPDVVPKKQTDRSDRSKYYLYRRIHSSADAKLNIKNMMQSVKKIKLKNGGIVAEEYPYAIEFFFIMVAWFGVIMYFIFVLNNYNVLKSRDLFEYCYDDNSRFYNPYADATEEENSYPQNY